MIKAKPPYTNDRKPYDDLLIKSANIIKQHIKNCDDDYVCMIIGEPGTGKSTVGLHLLNLYMGESASVDYVALTRQGFAKALKQSSLSEQPRCVMYDESNISKRDSSTKFNKQIIDLFLAIRGMNIFHIWCSPSLDMLDKHFIYERLKSVILCTSKKDGVRSYFYFPVKEIQKIIEKHGNVRLPLLRKLRHKHSYYMGWYRKYEGKLLQPYLEVKQDRMREKIDSFFQQWGNDSDDEIDNSKLKVYLGIKHTDTIKRYRSELIKRGLIKEGVDYRIVAGNLPRYKPSAVKHFEMLRDERNNNLKKTYIHKQNESSSQY